MRFFFSSRRRHTSWTGDWSSDVCSSDLYDAVTVYFTKAFSSNWLANVSYTASSLRGNLAGLYRPETAQLDPNINSDFDLKSLRSEERRVGKECRARLAQ